MKNRTRHLFSVRRGFSLMEVLLAVFILGIGLIMVATIFPIGADWTRQSTEDTVAQAVAQNAVAIIQNYYGPTGVNGGQLATLLPLIPSPTASVDLVALPGLTSIPIAERCYQFGNANPYPATNPAACSYYWTALVRVQPGQTTGSSRRYDLYILVFRKGSADQIFTPILPTGATAATEFRSPYPVRDDPSDPTNPSMSRLLEPTLLTANYSIGTYNATLTPPVQDAVPPIGFIGIGQTSGTVFKQGVATDFTTVSNTKAVARPALISAGEPIIYAAPADGTTASPLIYVYQTTVSF